MKAHWRFTVKVQLFDDTCSMGKGLTRYSKGTTTNTVSQPNTLSKLTFIWEWTTLDLIAESGISWYPASCVVHQVCVGFPNHTLQGCRSNHFTATMKWFIVELQVFEIVISAKYKISARPVSSEFLLANTIEDLAWRECEAPTTTLLILTALHCLCRSKITPALNYFFKEATSSSEKALWCTGDKSWAWWSDRLLLSDSRVVWLSDPLL